MLRSRNYSCVILSTGYPQEVWKTAALVLEDRHVRDVPGEVPVPVRGPGAGTPLPGAVLRRLAAPGPVPLPQPARAGGAVAARAPRAARSRVGPRGVRDRGRGADVPG